MLICTIPGVTTVTTSTLVYQSSLHGHEVSSSTLPWAIALCIVAAAAITLVIRAVAHSRRRAS
jgi:hypothetical protein